MTNSARRCTVGHERTAGNIGHAETYVQKHRAPRGRHAGDSRGAHRSDSRTTEQRGVTARLWKLDPG